MDEELRQTLSDIHSGVHEIKTSLFGVPNTADIGFIGETRASLADHGKRIGSLERYKWHIAGAIAAVLVAVELAVKAYFHNN